MPQVPTDPTDEVTHEQAYALEGCDQPPFGPDAIVVPDHYQLIGWLGSYEAEVVIGRYVALCQRVGQGWVAVTYGSLINSAREDIIAGRNADDPTVMTDLALAGQTGQPRMNKGIQWLVDGGFFIPVQRDPKGTIFAPQPKLFAIIGQNVGASA